MKKTFALLIIYSFIFMGCTDYMQLYQTNSNLPSNKNNWRYEDDTLAVNYNFWAEDGIMFFSIYNKINKPVYIDWKKSSFIINGRKLDYWADQTVINSNTYYSAYESNNTNINAYSDFIQSISSTFGSASSSNYSIISQQERVTFIPPHSGIVKVSYSLAPNYLSISKKDVKEQEFKDIYGDYELYSAKVDSLKNPFIFRNYLTYSSDEKFGYETNIDNTFWIDKVYEFPDPSRVNNVISKIKDFSSYKSFKKTVPEQNSWIKIRETRQNNIEAIKKNEEIINKNK